MIWNNTTIIDMGIIAQKVYNEDKDEYGNTLDYFSDNPDDLIVNGTTYTVIDHTDTSSDMQALLLESGGKYVIAFRGTASWVDALVDGQLKVLVIRRQQK